jgi:hypothetical protein
MGGQVRDYVKWWPQLATSMSPPDLWIMPLTARLAGDGGSRFIDSGSAGRMAAWGDVVDLRMLQAAGEATSAYPWGTLSLDEAAMGGERGYISFWDLPFGTPMTGRQNTPGAWTPIWLGTMDFAIRDNPLCTPKALAANLLASATGEGVGLWMGSLARGGAIARGGTYLSGSARLPQGLTASQFDEVAALLRGGASHIGDDIVVQGSRAAGTAGAASDMDFAIRVSPEQFNQLIVQRFGTARLGTAKGRTMLHAIETGKIQAGEAGLGGLRRLLQRQLGIDVDISIIQRGGAFDNGVTLPVP